MRAWEFQHNIHRRRTGKQRQPLIDRRGQEMRAGILQDSVAAAGHGLGLVGWNGSWSSRREGSQAGAWESDKNMLIITKDEKSSEIQQHILHRHLLQILQAPLHDLFQSYSTDYFLSYISSKYIDSCFQKNRHLLTAQHLHKSQTP